MPLVPPPLHPQPPWSPPTAFPKLDFLSNKTQKLENLNTRRCLLTLVGSSPQQGSKSTASDQDACTRDLLFAVSRANNPPPGSDPLQLQTDVENAAAKLIELNPTPSPAVSPLIAAQWVLLYTGPSRSLAPTQFQDLNASPQAGNLRRIVQNTSDASYSFFYKRFPLLAGSAVGRNRTGGSVVRNVQVIDTSAGTVDNIVQFERPFRGEIKVSGTAEAVEGGNGPGVRLKVVFTGFQVSVGGAMRLRLPLDWLSPVGFVDTLYLDMTTRVSVGDKGSLFVVRALGAEEGAEGFGE